jgi:hypothetical protein
MKYKIKTFLISIIISFGLIGCGGGSGSTSTEIVQDREISGTAVDGFLSGSTVWADVDGDGTQDEDEPSATTDELGNYTLQGVPLGQVIIAVKGGVDTFTNTPLKATLKNVVPEQSSTETSSTINLTPLSTLVVSVVQKGKTKQTALLEVSKSLNIADSSLLEKDLVSLAKASSGSEQTDALNAWNTGVNIIRMTETLSKVASTTTDDATIEVINDTLMDSIGELLSNGTDLDTIINDPTIAFNDSTDEQIDTQKVQDNKVYLIKALKASYIDQDTLSTLDNVENKMSILSNVSNQISTQITDKIVSSATLSEEDKDEAISSFVNGMIMMGGTSGVANKVSTDDAASTTLDVDSIQTILDEKVLTITIIESNAQQYTTLGLSDDTALSVGEATSLLDATATADDLIETIKEVINVAAQESGETVLVDDIDLSGLVTIIQETPDETTPAVDDNTEDAIEEETLEEETTEEEVANTSGGVTDKTSPTIDAISPIKNATNIALDANINITFSEALDASTITNSNIVLSDSNGVTISATLSLNDNVVTIDPSSDLLSETVYSISITTNVSDTAGNNLQTLYESQFKTEIGNVDVITYDDSKTYGSINVDYDGVSANNVEFSIPKGTFNIWVDTANGDSSILANIGDLKYSDDTSAINDIVALNQKTSNTAPAYVKIINSTDSEKTYILPVSAENKFTSNNSATSLWVAVVKDATAGYSTGGTLTLGDVDTNTGLVLKSDEIHSWYADIASGQSGVYKLDITTDDSVNRLMIFDVSMSVNGSGESKIYSSTTNGSFSELVSLDASTSYLIKITSTQNQWDILGKYSIKLIKQ